MSVISDQSSASRMCSRFQLAEYYHALVAPPEEYEEFYVLRDDGHEDQFDDYDIDVTSVLAGPGMHHYMHNSANRLLDVMSTASGCITPLEALCDLLSHEHTRSRLLATCFTSAVAQVAGKKIEKFKCKVHRKRWGSVAFAVDAVLDGTLVLLTRFFRLATFMRGSGQRYAELGANTESGLKLRLVSEALGSSNFEAELITLDAIYEVVRNVFAWIDGCSCHSHLDREGVPKDVLDLWDSMVAVERHVSGMARVLCFLVLVLVWLGLLWLGALWLGLVWLGLVWLGLGWSGLDWSGLDWSGLAWSGLDSPGLEWSGLGWFGWNSLGLHWFGMASVGLLLFGSVWAWFGLAWLGLALFGLAYYGVALFGVA